jgi:hypothetical protein
MPHSAGSLLQGATDGQELSNALKQGAIHGSIDHRVWASESEAGHREFQVAATGVSSHFYLTVRLTDPAGFIPCREVHQNLSLMTCGDVR